MSDELKDEIYHLTTERDEWHLRCEKAQAEILRLRKVLVLLEDAIEEALADPRPDTGEGR